MKNKQPEQSGLEAGSQSDVTEKGAVRTSGTFVTYIVNRYRDSFLWTASTRRNGPMMTPDVY